MPAEHLRFAAGFVLYESTPRGRRYLLLKNARHGTWGFPKGHRDARENDQECAVRELVEETGLTRIRVDTNFRREVRYPVPAAGDGVVKTTTYFLAEVLGGEVALSPEHAECRWLDAVAAQELLEFETLRGLIDAAEAHLVRETP